MSATGRRRQLPSLIAGLALVALSLAGVTLTAPAQASAPWDVFVNDKGKFQRISHVSYRFEGRDPGTCAENPDQEGCEEEPETCEENPDQEGCEEEPETCEENPDQPACEELPPGCAENPGQEGCQEGQVPCELNPDQEGCEEGPAEENPGGDNPGQDNPRGNDPAQGEVDTDSRVAATTEVLGAQASVGNSEGAARSPSVPSAVDAGLAPSQPKLPGAGGAAGVLAIGTALLGAVLIGAGCRPRRRSRVGAARA